MSAQFEDDMEFSVEPVEAKVPAPATPYGLLEIAVGKGAPIEHLEKLMDLQDRYNKEQARKAFNAARAKFQAICPEIIKDCETKAGPKYKYASLPAIIRQIKQPLAECGLAFRFEFGDTDGGALTVRCILCHTDGHCESNAMSGPPDDSGAKNEIQKRGSTSTYLQRYTLLGALGIATADDDDDGKSGGQTNVEDIIQHNAVARSWLDSIAAIKTCISTGQLEQAAEAWNEIPEADKRALWLAPTKGGMFTTKEREVMKSDEWAEARRNIIGAEK